jgi:GT2 family glycosyltransferase
VTAESELPPVAIALVNWNGWRDTLGCVESLERLRYPDPSIILCDNASTDESVERVAVWAQGRGWSARIVPHDMDGAERTALAAGEPRLLIARSARNRGFAGGTNIAIRYALASERQYKYVWVLNTDTTVAPESLSNAVRALEAHANAGSAQSLLVWARQPALLDSAGMRLLRRGGAMDIRHHHPLADLEPLLAGREAVEIFGCCAAAALYRVDVLRRVGLFDESLFQTHEDVDLACRLREHGYTAVLVPASIVHHLGGVSRDRKKGGWAWWLAHRNKLRIVARWYPRAIAVPILAVGVIRASIAALRSPDVSWRAWADLSRTLWFEWRGGATARARRRVFRLGAAKTIV